MQKEIAELVKLVGENPTLDVIPMVNPEFSSVDDYDYYAGRIVEVVLEEYVLISHDDMSEYRYKNDILADAIVLLEDLGTDTVDMSLEEVKDMYEKLAWKKAIFVYVEAAEVG